MGESKRFTLNRVDMNKLLIGACVAMAGALLTYVAENVGHVDFGEYTPIVVAVISILVNAGRKFIGGYNA